MQAIPTAVSLTSYARRKRGLHGHALRGPRPPDRSRHPQSPDRPHLPPLPNRRSPPTHGLEQGRRQNRRSPPDSCYIRDAPIPGAPRRSPSSSRSDTTPSHPDPQTPPSAPGSAPPASSAASSRSAAPAPPTRRTPAPRFPAASPPVRPPAAAHTPPPPYCAKPPTPGQQSRRRQPSSLRHFAPHNRPGHLRMDLLPQRRPVPSIQRHPRKHQQTLRQTGPPAWPFPSTRTRCIIRTQERSFP